MVEPNAGTEEAMSCPDVATFRVMPGVAPELVEGFFKAVVDTKKKALVLIGFATGTTPSAYNPLIQDLTTKGIPVFILSTNPANDYGVRSIKYETQQEAVEAGATPLQNVNINNALEVITQIQQSVNEGKTGLELTQAVVDRFGTPTRYTPKTSPA